MTEPPAFLDLDVAPGLRVRCLVRVEPRFPRSADGARHVQLFARVHSPKPSRLPTDAEAACMLEAARAAEETLNRELQDRR